MRAIDMLEVLLTSKNENCREIAIRILTKQTTSKEERKYTGSFMTAVLDGKYHKAIKKADILNLNCFYAYSKKNCVTAKLILIIPILDRANELGLDLNQWQHTTFNN